MRFRAVVATLATTLFLFFGSSAIADEPAAPDHASDWMKQKMAFSRNLLSGLATADFEVLAINARQLKSLTEFEDWVRGRKPEYLPGYGAQLKEFRDATDQILRMADQKNLDGAALGYFQLTLSCIECHKVVRGASRSSH
jgi:hypothetical protein